MFDSFFPFFLGLFEGSGSIQVNPFFQRSLSFRFLLKLKYSPQNYAMLSFFRDHFNLMHLHVRHNSVLLVEDDKSKIFNLIFFFNLSPYGFFTSLQRNLFFFLCYCLKFNVTFSEYVYIKRHFDF